MRRVSPERVAAQQVRAGQPVQQPRRGDLVDVAERGGAGEGGGGGGQAQQAEQALRLGVQPLVGAAEDLPDRGAAARIQQVQGAGPVQLRHDSGQRQVRLRAGVLGGQAQGEGEPGADGGQRVDAVRFGACPLTHQSGEQVDGVRRREQVERDAAGAVQGDQRRQAVPAGDHHEGVVVAGQ
ncbi:hypothetical protein AAFH96_03240 [Polymorphospora sp. 2-325]|uniref:Uncharacterized protein n=1 Tax=Polymorphospora lycopeni TaxID=3140240 RepID=A0ABV5CK22_9ACTN